MGRLKAWVGNAERSVAMSCKLQGGRHTDAGRIAYGRFTPDALDIVGGGTAIGNRIVKLWDNVDVSGTL